MMDKDSSIMSGRYKVIKALLFVAQLVGVILAGVGIATQPEIGLLDGGLKGAGFLVFVIGTLGHWFNYLEETA